MRLEPGTQILYVPNHANGDIAHPDVEAGFVTSGEGLTHFCRFWYKDWPGVLRTVANGECCLTANLVVKDTVAQFVVERQMAIINAEQRKSQ